MTIERRSISQPVEVRSEGEDKPKKIAGYAAVFYRAGDPSTEYRIDENIVERIHPGAFDAAIREDDVRCLYDHRADRILGRRAPGAMNATLRLSVDERGLRYECDPPESEKGVVESIARGDISGSSMGFGVRTDLGHKRGRVVWERRSDGVRVRNIYDLELRDVSPTPFPAYSGSSAEARSLALADAPPAEDESQESDDVILLSSVDLDD